MVETKDYVKLVCDASSRNYDDVKGEMIALEESMGITFKEFYQNQLWLKSVTQQHITAKRIIRKRKKFDKTYEKIAAALGITWEEARTLHRNANKHGEIKLKAETYSRYEIYRYTEDELDDVYALFARRKVLKSTLNGKLDAIDQNLTTYESLLPEMEELYSIVEKLMPEKLKSRLAKKVMISRPDLAEHPEKLHAVVVDMEVSKYWLGFSNAEYVAFHFADKSIAEKHEFISDKERLKVLKSINDVTKFDLLDDKFQAYSRLKKYYDRKMLCIYSDKDYLKFRWFCFRLDTIVVKPFFDSLGRGIKPVSVKNKKKLKKTFEKLCKEYKQFVVEELIYAHDVIKTLNPDSVNTVRMITYYNGKESIIHNTFMKVGKGGTFVDNGGAGGILIAVDPETGTLISHGCDENGVIYEKHPDTGTVFKGYQLPNWDKARALGLELSSKVPGIHYIGWDITYTKKNKWIVVEGNAKTQFFGQQCTTGVGVRKDFINTVNYKKEPKEDE